VECGAEITIRLELLPGKTIPRPRIETSTEIMTVASAESLDLAIKTSLLDMVDWLIEEKSLTAEEAYVLISITGDVRIGQIVDPAVTVRVALPRNIFLAD
jgi:amidase